MAVGIKLTEKEIASQLKSSAHVLITQPEELDGVQVESVRRLPLSTFVDPSLSVQNAAADAKATGTVRDNLDGDILCLTPQVVLPCTDGGAVYGGRLDKRGRVLYANGVLDSALVRLCLYGTFEYATKAPSYANKPAWYHDPCAQFTLGHRYSFDAVLLRGTFDRGGAEAPYLDMRTQDGTHVTIAAGTDWTCDFQPEMVCIGLRQGYTFTNAALYLLIRDETDADRLEAAEDAVDALEDAVGALQRDYDLPDYWLSEIGGRAAALSELDGLPVGGGVRFGFITDTHLRTAAGVMQNQCHAPELLRYLRDHVNLGLCFFGGDATSGGYLDKAAAIADIRFFRKTFAPCWDMLHCVIGNHDYGTNSNDGRWSAALEDIRWLYNALIRDKERQYASVDPDYGSYALDDAANGVRFICMNENHGGNYNQQRAWLSERLLETPAGWGIAVLCHRSMDYTLPDTPTIDGKLTASNSILPVAKAYNARGSYGGTDFSAGAAKVVCVIGGHSHFDASVQSADWGGIPVISVTCDVNAKGGVDAEGRETGTVNEQAFDIFDLIRGDGSWTIDAYRIGCGADRTWTVTV